MSKKQSEHIIEERIKEAAIKSEPPFEMYAWQKMEEKLDEKKGREKYFFIIAIVGALSLLFICLPKFIYENSVSNKINTEKMQAVKKRNNDKYIIDKYQHSKNYLDSINAQKQNKKLLSILNKKILKVVKSDLYQSGLSEKKEFFVKEKYKKSYIEIWDGFTQKYFDYGNDINQKRFDVIENNSFLLPIIPSDLYKSKSVVPENFVLSKKDFTTLKIDKKSTSGKVQKQNKKISRFYFLGSAGADMTSVKLLSYQNNSSVFKYGIGVGFDINKKISLQTGFYNSRKKYTAGPQDYKIEKGSYWDMVQITRVDAACLVYEIPITIKYNFLHKPSFNLYTSVGISSFIMKNEDYNYYYIRYNTPHESAWSYTGNKNLFSILNLNIGLEKKISPVFSFYAEPSLSIPLAGVGEGKVKLFSTSFQAGLKYQPCKNKK